MSFTRNLDLASLRRFGRTVGIASLLIGASCGFQPMHGERSISSIIGLANFDVGLIKNRIGQMMRNELLQVMQPRGSVRSPRFSLSVDLTESLASLAIRKNDIATRANLTLVADFKVINRSDGETVHTGQARSVNSYNILTTDFATLSAREDARKRAVRQLALDIKQRLSSWLIQTGGRKVSR